MLLDRFTPPRRGRRILYSSGSKLNEWFGHLNSNEREQDKELKNMRKEVKEERERRRHWKMMKNSETRKSNCAKEQKQLNKWKEKKKLRNHWPFIDERFGCNGCSGCNRDGSSLFHVACAKAAYAPFVFDLSHFFCFFLHLYVSSVSTNHEWKART